MRDSPEARFASWLSRLGHLTEKGQHWRSETVADFGATVLLEVLGLHAQSDRGFCWNYIKAYCAKTEQNPTAACMSVLKRTCEAINLILTESDSLQPEISALAS